MMSRLIVEEVRRLVEVKYWSRWSWKSNGLLKGFGALCNGGGKSDDSATYEADFKSLDTRAPRLWWNILVPTSQLKLYTAGRNSATKQREDKQ